VSGAHVLVTGGTGFVGTEVVRRLVAGGATAHVLCRPGTDRSALSLAEVRWHAGDLLDESALRLAFERAASEARAGGAPLDVVHLAARISYRRADRGLLERVNVEGTRRVLAACRAVGARRLCHVSSVVALGPVARADQELDDDAPLAALALASAYARTKAEAEALALAARNELDVVVASPAVVFGFSGSASNSLHFLRRVLRGTLGPLSPPGSISVVGLADAARGILLVLERGARGKRYLLSESAWLLHDLLVLACRNGGRTPPRGRVPPPLWRALVGLASLVDRIVPSERATPEALELLGMHFRFRARSARSELDWAPRPFAEILGELVRELGGEKR
jgi:dihydroflavonol-4-reductase